MFTAIVLMIKVTVSGSTKYKVLSIVANRSTSKIQIPVRKAMPVRENQSGVG